MKKALCMALCLCLIFALAAECFAATAFVKTDGGDYIEIEVSSGDTVSYIKSVVASKLKVSSSRLTMYHRMSKADSTDTLGDLGLDGKDDTIIFSYTLESESSSSSSSSKSFSSTRSSKSSSAASSERNPINIYSETEENPNTGADVYGSAIVALALISGAAVLIKKKK